MDINQKRRWKKRLSNPGNWSFIVAGLALFISALLIAS